MTDMDSAIRTRRAVVVHRDGSGVHVRCDVLSAPLLRTGEIRVRPDFVGVCGSDLEQIFGSMDASFDVQFPHVLGHEWSGVITETGGGTNRFRVGDRVVGHGVLGGNTWFGVSTDGAMADSFAVPESMCFTVPDGVSPLRAALVEPLACSLQALRVAGGADGGQVAVVFGCGAIGLAMVGLLHSVRATVVAVDPSAQRLAVASDLGADHCVVPDERTAEAVRALVGGADLVAECSGAPSAQADAIDVTAPEARVLFMGLAHGRADRVSLYQVQNRNLRLCSSTGAPPSIWQPTLRLLERTGLDLTPAVSDVFAFTACEEALTAARDSSRHAKVMLSPNGGGAA